LPGIAFASDRDLGPESAGFYVCERLRTPLPGFTNYRSWATFWKLIRLIQGL
jgi:hypothetical protein